MAAGIHVPCIVASYKAMVSRPVSVDALPASLIVTDPPGMCVAAGLR
jgi:hypothetical protein